MIGDSIHGLRGDIMTYIPPVRVDINEIEIVIFELQNFHLQLFSLSCNAQGRTVHYSRGGICQLGPS